MKDYGTTLSESWRWMVVGGQRHALATLTPRKRHGTHGTRDWVGPRVGLGGRGEEKSSLPHKGSSPEPSTQ